MTLFALPPGRRILLELERVGIAPAGRTVMVDRHVEVEATATADFDLLNGELRRRFCDCSPRLADHTTDVWVIDDEVYGYCGEPASALATASRWDI